MSAFFPEVSTTCEDWKNSQPVMTKIAMEDTEGAVRRTAVERLTDQNALARLAVEDKEGFVRQATFGRLTDQEVLIHLTQQHTIWEVRRRAFQRLDGKSLATLAQGARDPAVALAAQIRLQQSTWEQAFADARRLHKGLSSVLGAVELVDSPPLASHTLIQECIRQGDVACIPKLRALLMLYGDKALAEDYLNSGQAELEAISREWAGAHGYNITTGSGSHRVRWGSDRSR